MTTDYDNQFKLYKTNSDVRYRRENVAKYFHTKDEIRQFVFDNWWDEGILTQLCEYYSHGGDRCDGDNFYKSCMKDLPDILEGFIGTLIHPDSPNAEYAIYFRKHEVDKCNRPDFNQYEIKRITHYIRKVYIKPLKCINFSKGFPPSGCEEYITTKLPYLFTFPIIKP